MLKVEAYRKNRLFFIVFLILYILFVCASYCPVYAGDTDYKDIKGHWAENNIRDLIDKGYIKGVSINDQILFQPNRNITRAEFLAILMRTGDYKIDSTHKIIFSDVKDNDWFKESIDKAAGNQITGGYPDGSFKPNNQITRAEIASLIARAGKFDTAEITITSAFKDVQGNKWYYKNVMLAKQNGIIGGYPDGSFVPEGKATRAEVATMIFNYLKWQNGITSTPKPTPNIVLQPTGKIPGMGPLVTLPPEMIDEPIANNPKIYGFDINGSNKSEITYSIYHSNLSDLGKFSARISYDPSKIVAERISEGSLKSGGYLVNRGNIDLSKAANGEITVESNDSSNVAFTDGILFIIKFKVLPGAAGKADIKIYGVNSSVPEMYKLNGDRIDSIGVDNGAIVF